MRFAQYIAEEEDFFAAVLPSKLKAIEILAGMTSYNEPDNFEVKNRWQDRARRRRGDA